MRGKSGGWGSEEMIKEKNKKEKRRVGEMTGTAGVVRGREGVVKGGRG